MLMCRKTSTSTRVSSAIGAKYTIVTACSSSSYTIVGSVIRVVKSLSCAPRPLYWDSSIARRRSLKRRGSARMLVLLSLRRRSQAYSTCATHPGDSLVPRPNSQRPLPLLRPHTPGAPGGEVALSFCEAPLVPRCGCPVPPPPAAPPPRSP